MVAGVALGVAVVISVDLANEAARRSFARSSEAVTGRATHQLIGGPAGVPIGLLAEIRSGPTPPPSAPVVEGVVRATDLGGLPLRVLGVDPLSEGAFRSEVTGELLGAPGYERLFVEEGTLLASSLAQRYGLAPGDELRVRVGRRERALRVLGVLEGGSGAAAGLDDLLLMDVGVAQELLGVEGLSRIDLILDGDRRAELAARLPPGVRLAPASEQAETVGQLTAAFQLNLTALSLLALVVGMFLIYNTVMFSVVQRRPVIATLRALGCTGEQVFAMILAETAAAAALGSALGLALGWVLGQGVVRLVTRTVNDLYFFVSVTGAPLTLSSALEGIALGLGAGVVSAILPGLEASRVQPLAAMRASTLLETARRWLPRTAGAGVACAAAGAAVLVGVPGSIEASFAGLFGVVLGIALAVPLLTVGAMGLAAPVAARIAGPLGRLAARTVTRGVSRTGVAIAALTVAVSVTIGVSVMIDSFRDTVSNWLDLTLRADLYVSAPSPGARRSGTLPRDVPDRIASQPGVAEVETYRALRVFSEVGEIQLGVTDSRRARSGDLYRFTDGDPARAWRRFGEGAVVVSEPFAFRHGLPSSGGRIEILTDRGPRVFPVAGVFYDYTTEQGLVLMSRSSYERWWDDRGVTSVAAYLDPGASTEEVAAGLRRSLSVHGLGVVSNRALRENALRVFDRTFAVTQALRALAVIVAFVGVWSALMALQVERTRELATLSAVGVTPGELLRLTLLETGLMGLTAGLIALPTGVLLAVILVEVINVRSFGWTMELQLAPGVFVQALAVSVVAALLAALYPLRRLSRLPVAAALRTE